MPRARLISFVDAGRHVARLVQMEISFRDADVAAKVSSLSETFNPPLMINICPKSSGPTPCYYEKQRVSAGSGQPGSLSDCIGGAKRQCRADFLFTQVWARGRSWYSHRVRPS
jgi:hypothetical protein